MKDCREILEQMAPYLDRELSEAELSEVREHLAACECCAQAFRFEDSILRFVRRELVEEPLPEGFEKRLFQSIRECED